MLARVAAAITILDGPVGTELAARGVPTPLPQWSAWALAHRPEAVAAIHRDYAAAGATVHTANTFRTQRRIFPEDWERLARLAVAIARASVPPPQRVAGSMAPLEDCYSPWLSPPDPRPAHRALARVLADCGVDLLLCETFPHVGEALIALEEAVAAGVPSWVSFTAGPNADLLTPDEVHAAARSARERGAAAVLVNCVPAARTLEFVQALAGAGLPFGAYANAGAADERIGWKPEPLAAERYARLAAQWVAAGASIVGGCCGTGPEHVAALRSSASCRCSAR
ncbi:MAG: homocysteine S-methyltransferase family protein [Planctomycetota bacterium]|nr:MAG: homocysteine S-methyltransferase family protein [Planctomycetota bacterium]